MEWKPIDTVPGDEYGIGVIFALPGGDVGGGRSYVLKDGTRCYSFDSVWLEQYETPTHWMEYPLHPNLTRT